MKAYQYIAITSGIALAAVFTLAAGFTLAAQRVQQPSIAFGPAAISLGMTLPEVQQALSKAGQNMNLQSDEKPPMQTVMVENTDDGGQITLSNGRVVYAQYQMATAQSADELAQEIAGAVDNVETKTCVISNYSAHGTGGSFSQIIFQCGVKQINVMSTQTLGSSARRVHVNIQLGKYGPN
jgi:hypothetical protein